MSGRGLIESAMDRVSGERPETASGNAPGHPRLGRRAFDREILLRLERLASASLAQDADAPTPARATTLPWAAWRGRTYGPGALVLVAFLSAVLTAGAMWLAIGGSDRGNTEETVPSIVAAPPRPAPKAELDRIVTSSFTPTVLQGDVDEAQARDLIERWRMAWVTRDAETYLGSYSPDFRPADGQTRDSWAAARRKKLSGKAGISVQLHDIRIERIDANQIKAMFLQDYASGSYRENARPKTLLLTKAGGSWQIGGEFQNSPSVDRR